MRDAKLPAATRVSPTGYFPTRYVVDSDPERTDGDVVVDMADHAVALARRHPARRCDRPGSVVEGEERSAKRSCAILV
jgi:hypothetical protein